MPRSASRGRTWRCHGRGVPPGPGQEPQRVGDLAQRRDRKPALQQVRGLDAEDRRQRLPFIPAETGIVGLRVACLHSWAVTERKRTPLRILRELPEFRSIWLSKSISSTGSGVGRIALVLLVAPSGATAVALVLAGTALPMLLGPLAGAVADRVDQRRLLAATEAGQGAIYAALAITRPPLPVLLPLVILAAL